MPKDRSPEKREQQPTNTNPFQFDDGQPGANPAKKGPTQKGPTEKRSTSNPGEGANQDPEKEVAHPTMPQP